MKNKNIIIIAIVLLTIIGIVSGTYAYFINQLNAQNTFSADSYTTVVQRSLSNSSWTPGDSINNFDLNVKNQGNRQIMVRAKIEESLTRQSGDNRLSVPSTTLSNNQDLVIKSIDTTNWVAITKTVNNVSETWYYYKSVVSANGAQNNTDQTSNLITSLTLNSNAGADVHCTYDNNNSQSTDPHAGNATCESGANGYDGTIYTLSVTFETIQAGFSNQIWNVQENEFIS